MWRGGRRGRSQRGEDAERFYRRVFYEKFDIVLLSLGSFCFRFLCFYIVGGFYMSFERVGVL